MTSNDFDGLADPIPSVDQILKRLEDTPVNEEPYLFFVRFRDRHPQVGPFAELLFTQLVNYAVPLRKRVEAAAATSDSRTGGDATYFARLQMEARKLLIKYNQQHPGRYGEIGELIAYVMATHFLRAPQLGSKMALKTSTEMPVHGVDGLHARSEPTGEVTFFMLESKLIPDAADATREFCASVAEFQKSQESLNNELRLADDLSNLDALKGPARETAKAFFNRYADTPQSLLRRDVHVGSLVYSEPSYGKTLPPGTKPITKHEENFESLYGKTHGKHRTNLLAQAERKQLELGDCVVFLIAVPDVNALKAMFAEMNDGHIRH